MSIIARQTVRSARTALRQQQAPMLRRNLHVDNTHETVSVNHLSSITNSPGS